LPAFLLLRLLSKSLIGMKLVNSFFAYSTFLSSLFSACCVEMGTEEYYVHYIDGQTFLIAYIDTCDRRTLDFVVVKI